MLGTSAYEALYAGDVDFTGAFATWEGIDAGLKGTPMKFYFQQDGPSAGSHHVLVQSNTAWIEEHPEEAAAFVQALQKGYEYAVEKPEEAAQILLDENPGVFEDEELVFKSQEVLSAEYLADEDGVVGSQTLEEAAGLHRLPGRERLARRRERRRRHRAAGRVGPLHRRPHQQVRSESPDEHHPGPPVHAGRHPVADHRTTPSPTAAGGSRPPARHLGGTRRDPGRPAGRLAGAGRPRGCQAHPAAHPGARRPAGLGAPRGDRGTRRDADGDPGRVLGVAGPRVGAGDRWSISRRGCAARSCRCSWPRRPCRSSRSRP